MLVFTVVVEHRSSGRQFQLTTDAQFQLLECDPALPRERMELLARGERDPLGEFVFLYRGAKRA